MTKALALLLVFAPSAVLAAGSDPVPPTPAPAVRVGIGVDPGEILGTAFGAGLVRVLGVPSDERDGVPSATLYVPVRLLGWLHLEPSLGHARWSQTRTSSSTSGGATTTTTRQESDSATVIGLAAAWRAAFGGAAAFYVGPRLGLVLQSSLSKTVTTKGTLPAEESKRETSQTGWQAAACVGAEVLLGSAIALAAELEAGYLAPGEAKTESSGTAGSTSSENATYTNAGLRLRFFF